MTSIAQLLKEYSKESAEIEAPEETPVEPVDEIEEPVELELDTDEAGGAVLEEEGESLESTIYTLFEANESFESSVAMMEDMRDRGENFTELFGTIFNNMITSSFEARGVPVEIFGDDIVFSFESDNKNEDKKEGFFTRIWNMIKAAFTRMRDWVSRFFAWFRTSGKAVKKAAEKLKVAAEAKKKSGAKATADKISVKAFDDLYANGKVDANHAIAVLDQAQLKVFSSANALLRSATDAADDLASKAGSGVVDWVKTKLNLKTNYAKHLADVVNNNLLINLPGRRTLQVEVEDRKRGLKAKIKVIKEKSTIVIGETNVMSLDDIIKLSNGIIKLVDNVTNEASRFNEAFQKTKAMDTKNLKAGEGKGADEIREIASLITQGSVVARSLTSNISKIIFPIAKRAYVLGVINVRRYK